MTSNPVDAKFRELVDESLRFYQRFKSEAVPHSVPILFFGDLDAYQETKGLKVVTVGLNPSNREFPSGSTFERFPLMDGWEGEEPFDYAKYRESLCRYFHTCPCDWFDDYESVLCGVGASYFPRASPNIAVHTDFCTPLATAKVWSKLGDDTKDAFKEKGFPMWKDLIVYLKPDLVLASIGFNEHLRKLSPPVLWKIVFPNIAKPYKLRLVRKCFNGHPSVIVHGRQIHGQPFAGLTDSEKESVGKFIRKKYEQLTAKRRS